MRFARTAVDATTRSKRTLEPPAEDAAVRLRQLSVGGNVIGAETAKALQRAAEAARCVVQVYARDHARIMVKKR